VNLLEIARGEGMVPFGWRTRGGHVYRFSLWDRGVWCIGVEVLVHDTHDLKLAEVGRGEGPQHGGG